MVKLSAVTNVGKVSPGKMTCSCTNTVINVGNLSQSILSWVVHKHARVDWKSYNFAKYGKRLGVIFVIIVQSQTSLSLLFCVFCLISIKVNRKLAMLMAIKELKEHALKLLFFPEIAKMFVIQLNLSMRLVKKLVEGSLASSWSAT